jgi:Domain of unknown function (DUF4279)
MSCDKNTANTNATDEISVRLVITGFACDPHHITKLLGIQPDEAWRIGDELSFTSEHKRIDNGWAIVSKISNTVDLDAHVAAILEAIGNAKSHFKNLPQGSTVYLSCGITVNQGPGGPSVVFSPQMVASLAELGAEIGIDIYCLNCPEA